MLNVSGVGENKFVRYGQLFMDEIKSYEDEHPDVVISELVGAEDTAVDRARPVRIRNRDKKEFYITPEQAAEFEYGDMYYISEIKDRLNAISDLSSVKKVTIAKIWDILVNEELTFEENRNGVFIKNMTDKGIKAGIETIYKISQRGTPYELLRYPENVQRLIVETFVKEVEI